MSVIYSEDFTSYSVGVNLDSEGVTTSFGQSSPSPTVQQNSNWSNIKAYYLNATNWNNSVLLNPPDYTGDFEYSARVGTSGRISLIFRCPDSGTLWPSQGYFLQVIPNVANEVRLFKITGGSGADIVDQKSSVGLNVNDMTFKIRMEGNNIKTYINDVLYNDYTDGSPYTTYGGFGINEFSSAIYVTDVVIDNLVVPPPVIRPSVGGILLIKG